MRKHQLYNLVKSKRSKEKTYRRDQTLNASDHVALRLSSYNCDLIPIEIAWVAVKFFIRSNNVGAEFS
jgi:transposase